MLWIVFLIAGIIILVFWLIVMSRALDQVSHDIRKMEPGAVWLCAIPVFGLVWQFLVTNAVAKGIAGEFAVRNMFPAESKPGAAIGTTGCILVCCCIIPYAGVAVAIIGLIFLVIHISKISEYNSALKASGRWEVRYRERMSLMQQQNDQPNTPFQTQVTPQRNTFIPDSKIKPKNPFD